MQVLSCCMTFDKTKSAGFLANHMARLFAAELARGIAPLGLAPAQFMVLLELWEEDGLTQAQLVARLDVEQATMANTLKRMERDGLVVRVACDTDRRARLVRLTPEAQALRTQATEQAQGVNARALSTLSDAEHVTLLAAMGKVIAQLKRGA